jgi:hypothetical protein
MSLDLAQIEQLMSLARKHGVTVVKMGDVSIVLGAAPRVPGVNVARPGVMADAGLKTDAPPVAPDLALAIQAALTTDDDEPTPAEQQEIDLLTKWQRGEISAEELDVA